MKTGTIKTHLEPYSIKRKRETTLANAFASAIAPSDGNIARVDRKIENAIRFLRQDPDDDLLCVYCINEKAQTWDHLVGTVKNKQIREDEFVGHQIGNLVPCCKKCNSEKGNKDYKKFLEKKYPANKKVCRKKQKLLEGYQKKFATRTNLQRLKESMSDDWCQYEKLQSQIIRLMEKADDIAGSLRKHIV